MPINIIEKIINLCGKGRIGYDRNERKDEGTWDFRGGD